MKKYYAVKKGRKTGIFETWSECKEQVSGFSGADYKSFASLQEANDFLKVEKENLSEVDLLAYVDGSYNIKTKEYGYGCVIIEGQQVIQQLYGKGHLEEYISMRNVSGEILGCQKAIEYAIKHDYHHICIYYDYEGIEKWAKGLWKANKLGTINYVKKIQEYQKQIDISFIKVLAHSGDTYNEIADSLAKKAVGIKNGS